jgi:hypothetical protein
LETVRMLEMGTVMGLASVRGLDWAWRLGWAMESLSA